MKRQALVRRAARTARETIRVTPSHVLFLREFVGNGGLALDETFWRVDNGADEALLAAIEMALVNGWGSSKAAAKFIYDGTANDFVRSHVDLSGHSDGRDRVTEIFHAEINRAHGEAFMAGGEKTPGFAGWRYLLSPRHPAPDICDLLASQNLHGLGPGVYPTREACPWPAHPNTLSFVEMVFQDEVTAADNAGKESELEALQRLAPEIRAGVLGQTKAQYFEQGLIRRWMIRSPLASVQKRLIRQGLLDGNALASEVEQDHDVDF